MRVGTNSFFQSVQQNISRLSGDLQKLNEEVASEKKINRPSDDPIGLVDAMQTKTALAQFDQYGKNVQNSQSWADLTESALSQTLDLVTQAKQLATQMANGTQTAATRAQAAVQVSSLLDQAIAQGNSQLGEDIYSPAINPPRPPFRRSIPEGSIRRSTMAIRMTCRFRSASRRRSLWTKWPDRLHG